MFLASRYIQTSFLPGLWLERSGYRKVEDGQDVGCSSLGSELEGASHYLQYPKSQDYRFIS
jgi:hypothetical protein